MRKILIISKDGWFGDVAVRMGMEGGNDVRIAVVNPHWKDIYDDIRLPGFKKVGGWRELVGWCDYAILDDSDYAFKELKGQSQPGQVLSKAGVPTFGIGTSKSNFKIKNGIEYTGWNFAAMFENNRDAVHEIFEQLHIGDKYDTKSFKDINEAVKYLNEHPESKHVIKPELGDADKSLTYVGQLDNNQDTLKWLEMLPSRPDVGEIKSIDVEEKKDGIEVGVSAWFNGNKFIQPININFEHKKFASSEDGEGMGFHTGEQGTVTCYVTDQNNPIFKEIVKLEPFLRDVGYRGEMDLNCIVDNRGKIYVLEPTPRIGIPAIWNEIALHKSSNADLFHGLATGADVKLDASGWSTSVVLCSQGYPFQKEASKCSSGNVIFNVNTDNFKDIHLVEVKIDKKSNELVIPDCNMGYVACAVGTGNTLEKSMDDVYGRILGEYGKNIFFQGMYYRHDIGKRVIPQVKQLDALGFKFQ